MQKVAGIADDLSCFRSRAGYLAFGKRSQGQLRGHQQVGNFAHPLRPSLELRPGSPQLRLSIVWHIRFAQRYAGCWPPKYRRGRERHKELYETVPTRPSRAQSASPILCRNGCHCDFEMSDESDIRSSDCPLAAGRPPIHNSAVSGGRPMLARSCNESEQSDHRMSLKRSGRC
jgi:hypothetical protein